MDLYRHKIGTVLTKNDPFLKKNSIDNQLYSKNVRSGLNPIISTILKKAYQVIDKLFFMTLL
jgi:hypothetical protein